MRIGSNLMGLIFLYEEETGTQTHTEKTVQRYREDGYVYKTEETSESQLCRHFDLGLPDSGAVRK